MTNHPSPKWLRLLSLGLSIIENGIEISGHNHLDDLYKLEKTFVLQDVINTFLYITSLGYDYTYELHQLGFSPGQVTAIQDHLE